jgi:hypothetical protein|tara:strand:+ start:340 stop:540 length:201 start_codon:yes stop_codon:yes gene_type:complete
MPTLDVDENIKQVRANIENLTQEVYRLQGVLQTFMNLKKGGVNTIEIPNDPTQEVEELESIQENPE